MNVFVRIGYHIVRGLTKAYLKTFNEFQVWGEENIPEGPKIFCSNHFSAADPFFAITLMKEPVHMVIGPGFTVPFFKHILKAGEQINATPEHRKDVITKAVEYLDKGESVYIFPEGELNNQLELRQFYLGLARIYHQRQVPIVPIGLVAPRRHVKWSEPVEGKMQNETLLFAFKKYYANIGQALDLRGELASAPLADGREADERVTAKVRDRIEALIVDIKLNKFWS
jgi:1-acyl-sn-glycerol-3-phosphate acyltransferase